MHKPACSTRRAQTQASRSSVLLTGRDPGSGVDARPVAEGLNRSSVRRSARSSAISRRAEPSPAIVFACEGEDTQRENGKHMSLHEGTSISKRRPLPSRPSFAPLSTCAPACCRTYQAMRWSQSYVGSDCAWGPSSTVATSASAQNKGILAQQLRPEIADSGDCRRALFALRARHDLPALQPCPPPPKS